jgi:transposase
MKQKEIVGIDFSKDKFDVFCKVKAVHAVFSNSANGFKKFKKWLQKISGGETGDAFIVMEHTGIYTYLFEQYLYKEKMSFTKKPGYAIKHSVGIVRGKSDKVDAQRIAVYGWEKRDELIALMPDSKTSVRLKQLLSLRDKLVTDRAGYKGRMPEQQQFLNLKASDEMLKIQKAIIKAFDKQIVKTEAEIARTITKDDAAANSYKLLKSITGIGTVIAWYMLAYTDNFKKFATARQFACYVGIAPFGYDSGTSVKGRTEVSHFANKKLKSLLNQGALSASSFDPELKSYYEQKVASGKNKMSVLNVIRNKLVYRMFAVIKRHSPFETEWKIAA